MKEEDQIYEWAKNRFPAYVYIFGGLTIVYLIMFIVSVFQIWIDETYAMKLGATVVSLVLLTKIAHGVFMAYAKDIYDAEEKK